MRINRWLSFWLSPPVFPFPFIYQSALFYRYDTPDHPLGNMTRLFTSAAPGTKRLPTLQAMSTAPRRFNFSAVKWPGSKFSVCFH
ncbi:Hypothetical protein NTJ_04327 [Nesidiocoris tenuis]|uniref:Secreted protein n=1 Tax=Nesidiocoris tenuis TaxID=355587 RepID=A0ABN7AJG3_9HEMI|nr:Hypothetical protein NTJ_04327 [Nesidiocoris tenuis]